MASSEMTEHVAKLYRAIYAVVRRIPVGQVATYGQVAELAGIPGGARVAGAAMKVSKPGDRLPWQRVIGKAGPNRGRIAIHDPALVPLVPLLHVRLHPVRRARDPVELAAFWL